MLKRLLRYVAATPAKATINAVATEYPQRTLTATSSCSSHSGTALYETYIGGQRNLDVQMVKCS